MSDTTRSACSRTHRQAAIKVMHAGVRYHAHDGVPCLVPQLHLLQEAGPGCWPCGGSSAAAQGGALISEDKQPTAAGSVTSSDL
jgi:hypothetical protein